MSWDTLTIILFRGLAMILLILGGLASLLCGFNLYTKNAGSERDHLDVEIHGCKIKARTVGAVLMGTACFWAWAGVWARPTYERSSDAAYRVASPGYELVTSPIAARLTAPLASVISDPKSLQALFRNAVQEQNANPATVLKLNGQTAHYDPNSIEMNIADDGTYLLKAQVKSGQSFGIAYFAVEGSTGKITFRPWRVTGAASPDNSPNDLRLPNKGSVPRAPDPLPLPGKDNESKTRPPPLPLPDRR